MTDFSDRINEILKPFNEIQKMADQSGMIQGLVCPFSQAQNAFENIINTYSSLPKIELQLKDQLQVFKNLGEVLKNYAEQTPKHLLLIAQHGWFIEIDSELSFAAVTYKEIEKGDFEKVDQRLESYYSENLELIFDTLVDRHKNREKILREILLAYSNQSYYTLIPTVFSQVDGICYDFTKEKFFMKENRKKNKNLYLPKVTAELEKNAGSFLELYLSPLQNQTPIIAQESDLHKYPCRLNRHEIMHGVNSTYGTRTNSLKVISLLKYISDLLVEIK